MLGSNDMTPGVEVNFGEVNAGEIGFLGQPCLFKKNLLWVRDDVGFELVWSRRKSRTKC